MTFLRLKFIEVKCAAGKVSRSSNHCRDVNLRHALHTLEMGVRVSQVLKVLEVGSYRGGFSGVKLSVERDIENLFLIVLTGRNIKNDQNLSPEAIRSFNVNNQLPLVQKLIILEITVRKDYLKINFKTFFK